MSRITMTAMPASVNATAARFKTSRPFSAPIWVNIWDSNVPGARNNFCADSDNWLCTLAAGQITMPEYASRNLVVAACIVFAMGAHWLWTDYVHPTSGQEE